MGYAQMLKDEMEKRKRFSTSLGDDPAFIASAALSAYVSSSAGKALKVDEARGFIFDLIDKYVPKPFREALKRDVDDGLLGVTGMPGAAAASIFTRRIGGQNIPNRRELDVPFSPQKDDYCGANAVKTVLGFYGIPVSEDEIGSAISRHTFLDGGNVPSSAIGFINNQKGVTAVHYLCPDLEFIKRVIASGTPVMAITKDHMFVIRGFDDGKKELMAQNLWRGKNEEVMPYSEFGALGVVGCIVVVPRELPEVKREFCKQRPDGFQITTLELVPKRIGLGGTGGDRIAIGAEYGKTVGGMSFQAGAIGYNYLKGEKYGSYVLNRNLAFVDPSVKIRLDSRLGKFELNYSGYHPYDYVLENTPQRGAELRHYEWRKWASGEAKTDYERFKLVLGRAEAMGEKCIDYDTLYELIRELHSGKAKYGFERADADVEKIAKDYYDRIKKPIYGNGGTFDFLMTDSKAYLDTLSFLMDPNTMPDAPRRFVTRYDDISLTWSREILGTDVSLTAFGIAGTGGARLEVSRWGAHASFTKTKQGDNLSISLDFKGIDLLLDANNRGASGARYTNVNLSLGYSF